MQGLALLTQTAVSFLNAFGLMTLLQAFVGAVLFVYIVGFVWERITTRS